jgi:hypothetical protein
MSRLQEIVVKNLRKSGGILAVFRAFFANFSPQARSQAIHLNT